MEKEPYYFCTYFDKNYLVRGLALYNSLKKQQIEFELWVLCYDDYTYDLLAKLQKKEIKLIRLKAFEDANPELVAVKDERTLVEYYWSSTPLLPLHVFEQAHYIQALTYLDADLFFCKSPAEAYEEWGDNSVYIVSHRFPKGHEVTGPTNAGKFNVGYLSFQRDAEGLKCLKWWADRCIEWCFNRVEDGKLGDQKYLDDFPTLFKKVVQSDHLGINIGEWNIFGFTIHFDGKNFRVNSKYDLVVFHFNCVDLTNTNQMICVQGKNYRQIYKHYAESIGNAIAEVRILDPSFDFGFMKVSVLKKIYLKLRGRIVNIPN